MAPTNQNPFAGLKESELINVRQAARRAGEHQLAAAVTKELSDRRNAKQIADGQQLLAELLKKVK